MKFGLLGASKTGLSIAYHLWKKGHQPVFLWNRSRKSRAFSVIPFQVVTDEMARLPGGCDFVILSVSDDAVSEVAAKFRHTEAAAKVAIFHTSGALDSQVFHEYERAGSLHPVISISTLEEGIKILPQTIFTCEGKIARELQELAEEIGRKGIILTAQQKQAIHLSAVFLNNYLTGMIEKIKNFNQERGVENIGEILQGITEQTIHRGWQNPIEKTLTGPVKRGDVNTIKKHLKMLDDDKLFQQLYKNFGNILLKYVNMDKDNYKELEDLFKICEK